MRLNQLNRTGTAALDMISKISQEQEDTHLVPLVGSALFLHRPLDMGGVSLQIWDLAETAQIFLDTLHHFPETLALARTASENYLAPLHIYAPVVELPNVDGFAAKYGDKLWERDEAAYDYLVKVEPAARAYRELGVRAVITGRRRSQGAERENLDVLEVDERGLIKVNPLISWSFKDVKAYIDKE